MSRDALKDILKVSDHVVICGDAWVGVAHVT